MPHDETIIRALTAFEHRTLDAYTLIPWADMEPALKWINAERAMDGKRALKPEDVYLPDQEHEIAVLPKTAQWLDDAFRIASHTMLLRSPQAGNPVALINGYRKFQEAQRDHVQYRRGQHKTLHFGKNRRYKSLIVS